MNCNLPKITYPTLRLLLLVKICEAIYLWIDVLNAKQLVSTALTSSNPLESRLLRFDSIVKRVRSTASLATYRSAITLKLASTFGKSACWVAEQLVENWGKSDTKLLDAKAVFGESLLRDITVAVVSPGILEFSVHDGAIAAWLNLLMTQNDAELNSVGFQPSPGPEIFYCQHAYARCCALLRLGQQSKLYPAEPLLWLTQHDQFVLQDPAERGLLSELVAVVDDLAEEKDPLKLAISLSQALYLFEQKCRIFDVLQTGNSHRSQCRLGLVMITQRLLQSILQRNLGVCAPLEL